jgi:hypothetical protein
LAAKLVRAGVMESLELEAAGGASDQSPDIAMQTFAQEALEVCRANARLAEDVDYEVVDGYDVRLRQGTKVKKTSFYR